MKIKEIRQLLARKASTMIIGGFRPPEEPLTSWFGRVRVARADEAWPVHNEKPMLPLCQLNCGEMPFVPDSLSDIAFISVFISQDELPVDMPNGVGWQLRAYPGLDGLIEVAEPRIEGGIKRFPLRWEMIESDYPSLEDVIIELPANVKENYDERFENQHRSKVGGWPSLIQSEIFWAPMNEHPANPEYVFQIDSEEKARWAWGDGGTGYFGRGTGEAKDQWTLEWQCY